MARSDAVLVQQEIAEFGALGAPGRAGAPPGRADHRHPRHPGADRPLRARHRHRPEGVVPALQRAPGRLGPGRPADPGGQGRRRVDRQRPEGLDLGRPVRRPRHAAGPHRPRRAQAPGHLLLRLRHAPGRRRRAPAQGDDRPRALQRGLHHRRPGGRLRAHRRRQQRVGRRQHDAHERAGRPRLGRRQRGGRRPGPAGHRAWACWASGSATWSRHRAAAEVRREAGPEDPAAGRRPGRHARRGRPC